MSLSSAVSTWTCLVPGGGASVRPNHSLAWPGRRCDGGGGPQPPINHNCFNSINDVFHRGALARGWNPSFKRMIWLGYFHRDLGSGKGPPQARKVLARGAAMPRAGPRAGRVRGALRPGPDAHHRLAASRPRRLRVAAGVAAAPNQRLRIDDDPFGPVGDYGGGFLVKSAIELGGGYDTNPRRSAAAKGSPFYVVAPEFLAVSGWERHAVVADLRGSFAGYGNTFPPPADGTISSAPVDIDRPDFTGHIDRRLDVSHDTRLLGQMRLRVSTDNPRSPNIQAGLARYPVYATIGSTVGADQNFNRLRLSAAGPSDRTVHPNSDLTDGSSTSNDDRNFNQCG